MNKENCIKKFHLLLWLVCSVVGTKPTGTVWSSTMQSLKTKHLNFPRPSMQRCIFQAPLAATTGGLCGIRWRPLETWSSTWLGASLLPSSLDQRSCHLQAPSLSPSAKPGVAEPPAHGIRGWPSSPRSATCWDCEIGWHKLSHVTQIPLNCSQFEHGCSFFWESFCFRQSFSTSFYTTRVYIIPPNCLQADSLSGALTTLLPKGQPD